MPRKVLPRIEAVDVTDEPLTVRVRWSQGRRDEIDLAALVNAFKVFAPLRESPGLFGVVKVGEHGTDIVWNDDIDISNDTLWRLAQEQTGKTMSAEAFRRWRERHALTLEAAAKALGISRRMVAYYDAGQKPIPRVVALATRGLDVAS